MINNPFAIRQEIQRFESVHPSIYAVYDLIELIPDIQIATQIREHIVNIEGMYMQKEFYYTLYFFSPLFSSFLFLSHMIHPFPALPKSSASLPP